MPQRVGKTELAAFVLMPALLPLIFGGQWKSAIVTAVANLVLLGLIYAVVGYGLLWILRWVLGRLAGQLRSALGLIAKALPLLLIFALLSFTTQESWQIFPGVTTPIFFVIIGAVRRPRLALPGGADPGRGPVARARGGRRRAAARPPPAAERRAW